MSHATLSPIRPTCKLTQHPAQARFCQACCHRQSTLMYAGSCFSCHGLDLAEPRLLTAQVKDLASPKATHVLLTTTNKQHIEFFFVLSCCGT
ncbi:unnamed protein product [Prunus armeniaca]|nr:unnamed protein product [Prunus armeniaca]